MSKDLKNNESNSSSGQVKGWYEDRYQALVVQRNLFFVIILACIAAIVISVVVVGVLSEKKTIEPMVIEVEDKTGITNIVNPNEDRQWTVDKTINKYFLMKYLKARETYNVASYNYNYNTVVRLLSSTSVYNQFQQLISSSSQNPVAMYGSTVSTTLRLRSILFLQSKVSGQSAQIRFAIVTSDGRVFPKIVSMIWNYETLSLNFDDRMVNPLGFQVQSYSIADDINV